MSLFARKKSRIRVLIICLSLLMSSLFTLAQVLLPYRLLGGYALTSEAPTQKGKPTLLVCEDKTEFDALFTASGQSRPPNVPNFAKETVVGIVLSPTEKPPKLSVSKVFTQDSTLTIRYIRLPDTTHTASAATVARPMLLLALPKQTVLRTKLVENGKVVLTRKRLED